MKHASLIALPAVVGSLLAMAGARAQPAYPDCAANYPGGFPPNVTNPGLAGSVRELCYDGFGVSFSSSAAGPLTSSHFLTRTRVAAAAQGAPVSIMQMHAEDRLPASLRAQSADFARAGFGMIQLTPGAAMNEPEARAATTTMANAVPVAPGFAKGPWASVDRVVRALVTHADVVYVATGSIYSPSDRKATIAGHVSVPGAIFKALFNPSEGWAGAYVCTNSDASTCQVVTLERLQAMSGVDVFPALSTALKQTPPPLPAL